MEHFTDIGYFLKLSGIFATLAVGALIEGIPELAVVLLAMTAIVLPLGVYNWWMERHEEIEC